jgi:tRNA A-37 threonylcarbamoyl transferase component Bud32
MRPSRVLVVDLLWTGRENNSGWSRKIERSIQKPVFADRLNNIIQYERWQGVADQNLLDTVGIGGLTVGLDEAMRRGAVLKNGSKSLVSHVNLGDAEVVIKGYHHLGLLHSIRHTFKGSRAKQAWLTANCLCGLEIPTPRPLAYIDEYKGPLLWRSYFIYEYIAGPGLNAVLNDPAATEDRKRRLIDQVLEMLARLSDQGISHGDLKHTNMICSGDQVVFIDLDALRQTFGPGFLKRYRYEKDKTRFLRDIRRV